MTPQPPLARFQKIVHFGCRTLPLVWDLQRDLFPRYDCKEAPLNSGNESNAWWTDRSGIIGCFQNIWHCSFFIPGTRSSTSTGPAPQEWRRWWASKACAIATPKDPVSRKTSILATMCLRPHFPSPDRRPCATAMQASQLGLTTTGSSRIATSCQSPSSTLDILTKRDRSITFTFTETISPTKEKKPKILEIT